MIRGTGEPLVGLHVLLEVILTTKGLPAPGQGAAEGLDTGVDPLVPGELLVPCKRLPALRKRTLIRPLAYKQSWVILMDTFNYLQRQSAKS